MSLVSLVLTLVVVGVLLYLVSLIPMNATIQRVIQVLVILFVIIWVIQSIGLLGAGPSIRLH
jgi:hypothetical protein